MEETWDGLEGRGQEPWEPSQARASSPPGTAKHGPQRQIINLESSGLTSGGSAWISPEVSRGLRGGDRHANAPCSLWSICYTRRPTEKWGRKGRKPKAGELATHPAGPE